MKYITFLILPFFTNFSIFTIYIRCYFIHTFYTYTVILRSRRILLFNLTFIPIDLV